MVSKWIVGVDLTLVLAQRRHRAEPTRSAPGRGPLLKEPGVRGPNSITAPIPTTAARIARLRLRMIACSVMRSVQRDWPADALVLRTRCASDRQEHREVKPRAKGNG